MQTDELITANEFCAHYNIEISFIKSLQESGLVEITTIEETGFIHTSQLPQLEKWMRLYYEMNINLEGIETISHLLQQINSMQDQIQELKNRLRLYE